MVASASAPAEAKAIVLQLSFTAPPRQFVVRHLEKDVWEETAPEAEMEREIAVVFPEQGVDLIFRFEWPEDAPLSAARVRFIDPQGERYEKSVWGQGTTEEVLTFP